LSSSRLSRPSGRPTMGPYKRPVHALTGA
jgi:hypothetical protein